LSPISHWLAPRRDGLSIEGSPAREDSDVVWLQAGRHFADVRSPRAGSDAAYWQLRGAAWHRCWGVGDDAGSLRLPGPDALQADSIPSPLPSWSSADWRCVEQGAIVPARTSATR
jgi:hypothetical protein